MNLAQRIQACGLSPMRKFLPYELQARQQGKHIYHLNIGQPDLATPPAFFQAVRQMQMPVLSYAPSPGAPELLEAIAGYYAALQVRYNRDDMLITAGGSEALLFLMLCILDPGSEVLIPEPFYPNYNTFVQMAGGVVRPIPAPAQAGYRFDDRAAIEACITANTRAILVSNPGNPTGVVLTAQERRLLADIAVAHDLYLICDEVYREFCYEDAGLSTFATLEDAAQHIVVVDSVSKRFSACGARIGCILSKNRQLMGELLKLCQARLSVATVDQLAAAALYSVGPDYFDAVRAEYRRRRDTVIDCLRRVPGVTFTQPQGAFYLMADLPVDDTDAFGQWLLTDFSHNQETVMFAPGAPFYATKGRGRSEVRMAYVLEPQALARAVELLALGLERYTNR